MTVNALHDNPSFRIIQFNVGQGDHCLIQFSDGEYGIVDFYFDNQNSNLVEPPAITFFRHLDEDVEIKIKFICISHLDKDHIKGFEEALHTLMFDFEAVISEIWVPAYIDFRDYFPEKLIDSAILRNIIEETVSGAKLNYMQSDRFQRIAFLHSEDMYAKLVEFISQGTDSKKLDKNEIEFLAPDNKTIVSNQKKTLDTVTQLLINVIKQLEDSDNAPPINNKLYKDQTERNDLSLVFNIMDSRGTFTFTGDANHDVMLKVAEKTKNIQFLKGAHHGSKFSSSIKLWTKLFDNSSNLNIGFSAGNKVGNTDHPDMETINHICETGDENQYRVLSTNLRTECIKTGSVFNLQSKELNIFKFPGSNDEYYDFPDSEKRESKDQDGLLGFLYEFQETGEIEPLILTSPGTLIYNDPHGLMYPLSESN